MNYGLDWEKELADRKPTDYIFGALSQPCIYSVPMTLRDQFLPIGEVQRGLEDFQDCASRGPLNIIETKLTYAFKSNLLKPENKKWLDDNGYITSGRVQLSDRFVAIKSGTTKKGNSLIAPLDTIHNSGCVPKWKLPANSQMTWEDYHRKSDITPELEALGEEFSERFRFQYERTNELHFSEILLDDFIDVALHAWPEWDSNGVYPRTDKQPNHVVALYKLPKYYVYDNYTDWDADFIKRLADNYDFYETGYRCYFSAERTKAEIIAEKKTLIGLLERLIYFMKLRASLVAKQLGYA